MPTGLEAHLRAEEHARPIEAIPRRGERGIDLGSQPQQARLAIAEAIRARAAAKTGGRRPCQAVDVLMCGPPAMEAPNAWPVERVTAWARDSAAWLRSVLPAGTPVGTLSLHTDERGPHVHGWFPPALEDAHGVYALSWERACGHMVKQACGRELRTPGAQMRALQNAYHAAVASKYGLERGKLGRYTEYDPPDREKGLAARATETAARLEEAQERNAKLEADLDKEREEADRTVAHYQQRAEDLVRRVRKTEKDRADDKRAAEKKRRQDRQDATERFNRATKTAENTIAHYQRESQEKGRRLQTAMAEADTERKRGAGLEAALKTTEKTAAEATEAYDTAAAYAEAQADRADALERRLETTEADHDRERHGRAGLRARTAHRPAPSPPSARSTRPPVRNFTPQRTTRTTLPPPARDRTRGTKRGGPSR